MDKRLALKVTKVCMVPIFTARTLIKFLWTSSLTNFIQVERKIQRLGGGGVISLPPYSVLTAVQYRISSKSVKKYGSQVCEFNTV